MQIKITQSIKTVKVLVEKIIDTLKTEQAKGPQKYAVSFQITLNAGEQTDSGTLAILDSLKGALSKFSGDQIVAFAIGCPPVNEKEAELLASVQKNMQTYLELQENVAPPKLVAANE